MPRLPAPALRTERLVLRAPRERDAGALYRLRGDAAVYETLGGAPWESPAEALHEIRQHRLAQRAGTRMGYVVTLRHGREVAGWCGAKHIDSANGLAEVAYWLGRPYWGRGLMSEALGRALAHLFEEVGLFRVSATVFPTNRRSKATLARLGFRKEGLLRKYHCRVKDGLRRDAEMHALLRTDPAARRLLRAAARARD